MIDAELGDAMDAREGLDFDWVLTRGADMSQHYAYAVQSYLGDIEAVRGVGDWPTCVAASALALRSMLECQLLATGLSLTITEIEMQLRIATDPSPIAEAIRTISEFERVDATAADQAAELVGANDRRLIAMMPITAPVLRSPNGSAKSMRLSASLLKWQKERGISR
jgi:hypothetical protein